MVAVAVADWLPAAPKFTVLVPAEKTDPVPFQASALTKFKFNVLDPPSNVPAMRVISPEFAVWVSPEPKFKVPPNPLMTKLLFSPLFRSEIV